MAAVAPIATLRWALKHTTRMAAVAARDPSLIGSVALRHPLKSSWELAEPWWPIPAVRYLQARLPERAHVFEWGSGGSTAWFAGRGAEVVAIESERAWYERVRVRVPQADVRLIPGADTGALRSEPELRDRGQHFFDDYVAAIDDFPDDTFDVIVVDGIARCECARRSRPKVRPGGLVVLDDSNWEHLFAPVFECFRGWGLRRIRGFKRPLEIQSGETAFFQRPE